MRTIAVDYVRHGFVLVPFARGVKGPGQSGADKSWNLRENCISTVARAEKLNGGNIGIAHAYARTCAIDFDDFQKGAEWFAAQGIDIAAYLMRDDAVQITSGRKNRAKLLYRLPEGVEPLPTKKLEAVHLELRCASSNGLTVQDVLPPSIHPVTGKPYEWIGDWTQLPVLPDELLTAWRALLKGKTEDGDDRFDISAALAGIAEGHRDNKLHKYACSLQSRGTPKVEALALIEHAAKNCDPPFDVRTAREKVEDAYRRYDLPDEIPTTLDGAVLLPSDFMPFTDAAAQIFPRFAELRELFIRAGGGVVVELTRRGGAAELAALPPAAFRSRLEKLGPTYRHYRDKGKLKLGLARCSMDSAAALLATREAAELLPPIRAVVNAPVLALVKGVPKVLGPGYNPEAGGVLVLGNKLPVDVPLPKAVAALRGLLCDFDFVSPGDESRALAAMITPALAIGGLLEGGPFPVEIAESDRSQTGKGFRMKKVCAIYNERPYLIGQRTGGVGSLDESVSAGLLSGRPFLRCDNLRGRIESAFIEMIVTAGGDTVNVRVPHRGEVPIDASGVLFQLTSNGVETTPDLANRSSIVRMRKRTPGYRWHEWPEGDLLEHVAARQPFYLGCVHSVVRAWIAAGRPRKDNAGHDLRAWAGSLDWIAQELFKVSPLMEGHRAVQERVADRALIWLRDVALAMIRAGRAGQNQSASAIWELCDLEGIELPGSKREVDELRGRQRIGQILGRVFREADSVVLDGLRIERLEAPHYDDGQQKETTRRVYVFGGADEPVI
jgi:hypothetical protein